MYNSGLVWSLNDPLIELKKSYKSNLCCFRAPVTGFDMSKLCHIP
jgi:hypothetical protein